MTDVWAQKATFAATMNEHAPVIRRFRWVAILEGISFLVLLFIAMPLKYLADMPLAVKYVGWAHGILFIGYIVLAIPLFTRLKWPIERVYGVGIASLLPFGTFVLERRWLR
jgi:integral membrane protein